MEDVEYEDDILDDVLSEVSGSHAEVEKVEEEICVSEVKQPIPEYTDEEMKKLIFSIKKMTILFALNEEDWNAECLAVIKKWFMEVNEIMLVMYYDGDKLCASLTFPVAPVYDITYFLREPNYIFTVDEFHDDIIFGTIHEDIDGTLLAVLEKVYAPIFFSSHTFNDNVKDYFCSALNKFLTFLTGLHHKMSGVTVLYVPSEALGITVEDALKDKRLVKRLEAVTAHWTGLIRLCLGDNELLIPLELLCPPDEHDFWAYRFEVLRGLDLQMEHPDFNKIEEILEKSQSIYVKQLHDLHEKIRIELDKANDNIDNLQLLIEPCNDLNAVETPADIAPKLKKIFLLIRVIWKHSKYFNTAEHITTLIRDLSNQITIFCRKKIDVHHILDGHPRMGIKISNMSVDCCLAYKLIYEHIANRYDWKLDVAKMFNHIDAFVQRLYDFIEICNAMIVFGRLDETVQIPKPLFGGNRGREFENICQEIEKQFNDGLVTIKNISTRILDVYNTDWYCDVAKYRQLIRGLEEIVENLMSNVFLSVCNVEESIEALCSLYYFSIRTNLRPAYLRKTSEVWKQLFDEIEQTNKDLLDEVNVRPSWLPKYAGRAIILKTNLSRITRLKLIFEKSEWLPDNSNSFKAIKAYDQLNSSITKTIKTLNEQWLDETPSDISSKLNRTLMCRSVTHPGLLECNIDRSILELCEEARHFEMLDFIIPFHIMQIYSKYITIRLVYESVVTVVLDYNKILTSLSDKERVLFKALIKSCDRKIAPGIYKLTWSGELIDAYIADCVKHTAELQHFVDIYKQINFSVVKICEKICDKPIIKISTSSPIALSELNAIIEQYRKTTTLELLGYFNKIANSIVVVYEGFEPQMDNMPMEWINYVHKFDNLIQEALKCCAINSLQSLYVSLHGDGTMGPSSLLQIEIGLLKNRLNFTPHVQELTTYLKNIPKLLIAAIKRFPRLTEKFSLPLSDNLPPFHDTIEKDPEFNRLRNLIFEEINRNYEQIYEYSKIWSPYSTFWAVDKNEFMKSLQQKDVPASAFDINLIKYNEIETKIAIQETISTVYFVEINSSSLKNEIYMHLEEWREKHKLLLKTNAYAKITNLYEYTKENAEQILKIPKSIGQMQEAIDQYALLEQEIQQKESEFAGIRDYFLILNKYEVIISSSIRQMESNMDSQWEWYLGNLKEAKELLENCKDSFKLALLEETESLKNNAKNLLKSFATLPTTATKSAKKALAEINELKQKLQTLNNEETRLINDLKLLGINIPKNIDLKLLEKEIDILQEVWMLANEWDEAWNQYKSVNFWTVEVEEMETSSGGLYRKLNRLSKQLKNRNWEIVEVAKKMVDEFRRTLPLLVALKNPSMRSRHWTRVQETVMINFDQTSELFNLDLIVQMNFQKYADVITDISQSATKELQIEVAIKTISELWETMQFEMISYRNDIYRIQNVDNCFAALEENAVQISAMKSTRYVEPFIREVDYWEKTLNYIMETLEYSLIVQRQWLYMENIFQGEDIRKTLSQEAKQFDSLTIEWQEITSNMFFASNAFGATHYQPPNYVLDKLVKMNEQFDLIQRALEIYLETKRQLFPRFYFISNDELLEILGNAKRPDNVQPHLKKLFDNLNKCKLKRITVARIQKWEAQEMYSEDGEYVRFIQPIILAGPAEVWLAVIERSMHDTLKDKLRLTRMSLRKSEIDRNKWLEMWPGQLCLTSAQIQWTFNCTRTLSICKMIDNKKPMRRLRRKQNKILSKLSEMSRSKLDKQMRLKVNTLITIEIHGRDVIDKMYKINCIDVSNFEWFSQLRFYWDRDMDNCAIRQTNTTNWYGYEYTGNSGRLVVTPLTDRCYITLTTAIHLCRGGSPKGPAGTGKTETVKDLGKAFGKWVIVTNCSEGLDYKSMGKCFSGLAQTGAWGCFDEFNRINIEVLSVVAQQINSILTALSAKLKSFVFEGTKINLIPTVGLFITMNPGYAGRTELPDNLKSMFRPISMIVPDNVIIAENLLFSDGFQNARILAKKVFTLYELAKQQLSKQHHYDFGLRSMVALLRYAGIKRRQFPQENEERIIYLAMQDMNIAKLTSDDLPLFNGIMSDIFPGVTVPTVDYKEFFVCVEKVFQEAGLQKVSRSIEKVIQLYETKMSRHSVMILGDTGTGKSVCWKMLQNAMMEMKKLNNDWDEAIVYPINPKALSLGELYGEYNLSTGEWLDGVLSSIMRKICADESDTQKWMLFDGPVDAVWIENMNSVMDDNKVLTLVNSERITMPAQVSLLFEVGDLSVASPATVSRCGMIYNDYKDLGWRPYIDSWLAKQKSTKYVEILNDLLDQFMDKILNFKRLHCEETAATTEFNLIQSFCRLMSCLVTKENGFDFIDVESLEVMTKLWFLFCVIWTIGGSVNETGRIKIDNFIRDIEGCFPLKETVYDYYVDVKQKAFILWDNKLKDNWKYPSDIPFHNIIVPTIDTVRYNFLVGKLLKGKCPVLLVGPVGTGKSSTATSVLNDFNPNKYSLLSINMSAQTTSNNMQETIEGRTEKRTKSVYVPIGGKTMICFMDDFNMPAKDVYGSQHALELMRQWIDYGFWYDRKKQWRIFVKQMLLLAGMGPAGGGRQTISSRTQSRFNCINMIFPSEKTITRIFGTMLDQKLSEFPKEIKSLGKKITQASVSLCNEITLKMLPTPAKIHYLFNLRDISRIFQGLLRCHQDYHVSKEIMLRLWIHETYRVFCDRLINEADQIWFEDQLNQQLGKHFDITLRNLCPSNKPPIFGDFISATYYEDITDLTALRLFMISQLDDYNNYPGFISMDLVLFKEAIEHVVRILRVISQPRGNMLLIGIGGSGRQSLANLAAFICDYGVFKIEINKKYKTTEFREDLKALYTKVGVENRPTLFLFNDNQVAEENFMEILNNMLSISEVSNLYKPEEFEEIKSQLEAVAVKAKIVQNTESMFKFFMDRAKSNLHIVLNMSPIGNNFRTRIRQYPALVNNTTIDWFHNWPESALLEVANKFLQSCQLDVSAYERQKSEARRESLVESTEDRLRNAVASSFATIHTSVSKMSDRMLFELKRHNYVTPTNYLELVSGMLTEKRKFISDSANKLRNGLFKIDDTKEKVQGMSEELKISQQQVIEFQEECDKFIVRIQQETTEADEKNVAVSEQRQLISKEGDEIKVLAEAAQTDLQKAMPALDAATLALNALNQKDLTEVKSYANPPTKVEKVMESVMILQCKDPTWIEAKRQLGQSNFLDKLRNFDKNHISDKTLKKIARYTQDPELEPNKVGVVSKACKSLSLWVRAIEKYGKIYKVVGPKIQLVEKLEQSLKLKKEQLAEAQRKLDELATRLAKLKIDYDEKAAMKENLRQKAEHLKLKLERAHLLVDGLSGERVRWTETVKRLDKEFSKLSGDCLISTAFIAYLGPFTSTYREELMNEWLAELLSNDIPTTSDFVIKNFMADAPTIREWTIQGLPSDEFSTENGIIITNCSRWPLIVDPQCQAQNWIKKMERKNQLKILDFGQANYVRELEQALQFGRPVLLENVAEILEPLIGPVLNRAFVMEAGQIMIKFNEKFIPFNENFRLFITTKLPNPHYPPEISTKTTLVNFAVKESGLEAQLLGIVVRKEKPSLEDQKDSLVVNIAQNKKTLIELETEILRMLNESRGSLLDDDELFCTLQTSKKTSGIVKESLSIAEITEVEIDAAREGYRASACRAAILFFVLMDLSMIDPMYQFSLDAYIGLFIQSIEKSGKHSEITERILNLNKFHTYAVYRNTCRGLFEKHKLLFSFHMCAKILESDGKLNTVEYNFLLKGGVVLDRQKQVKNPCSKWISDLSWDNITKLDKLPGFHGVTDSFEKNQKDWLEWFQTTEPESLDLVGDWQDLCNEFQKMLFIRCLRPDRMPACVRNFVVNTLEPKFVEPPALDLKSVVEESRTKTPLIFILSPGVDPTTSLLQLAENEHMSSRFHSLSLGQGQAPIATKMIMQGVRHGHWVFLANCHLSLSWMPELDKIVDTLQTVKTHRKFRLWLSSNPTSQFPISILQAGIKMTTEPPKGIRANLKRLYNIVTEDQFAMCIAKEKYKKLLFSLCFFHTVLLERKKFQELGWNVAYSFNDADFEISENLLSIYLDEYPEATPWDAIQYLIAGVNYGGHVTDDWDRRLLTTYADQFYCEESITTPQFRLSSLTTYYIPRDGNLQSYHDYINLLPNIDDPEAFGQHPNADIATLISDARILFETLVSLQVQSSSADGQNSEENVNQLAADILSKLPQQIDYENTVKLIGANRSPLAVILLQEIERYNVLLRNMKTGLEELQKGIKGLVVISSDLEDIFRAIKEGRVPNVWLEAYPSLKPLGTWTRDLIQRIDHFSVWAQTTHPPNLFWLSAFTFPTGFLTAVLQTSARQNKVPIDTLSWEYKVLNLNETGKTDAPDEGVFVRGMFLEGASWSQDEQCLIEPKPMELVSAMPVIHFKPVEQTKRKNRRIYQCPCYYYPERASSFITAVDLKAGQANAEFWIKRGTALLLSLSN